MLQTVLKIGKEFCESEENFKYHRYIKQCPPDTDKLRILRLSIPVDDNFNFKIGERKEIIDENITAKKLFYLTFKTSDADTAKRYLYGDIYYGINKDSKEVGNYKIKNGAFEFDESLIKNCDNKKILKFQEEFKRQHKEIEKILLELKEKEYKAVFLHFDFENEQCKHWYDKDEIDAIDAILIDNFFINDKDERLVLRTMLHRTISSGNEKNDIQFADFDIKNRYKSCSFSREEAKNLFYAINYTEKPVIRINKNNDINIIALPQGDNLSDSDYDEFNKNACSLDNEIKQEKKLADATEPSEELFEPLIKEKIAGNIVKFDLIFCKQGGMTSPWVDMIELTSVEKSDLQRINERIKKIKKDMPNYKYINKINILDSFYNILGNMSESKKYKNHLYKVLPQIYTETYYDDQILLPALIEKAEYNIRTQNGYKFNEKYDFYFLMMLQNNNKNKEGENLMNIKESKSYKIGFLLGKLALPFAAWRDDCPIKSFEKSYIGNLSRRIVTLDELIKFKNFIDEKLTIHERERLYKDIKVASCELAQEINDFSGKYNKDECIFGFFEAYFDYKSESSRPHGQELPSEQNNNLEEQ